MELSVIILSYNSKADLQRLLPSIFRSEGFLFDPRPAVQGSVNGFYAEVIIIDNGSTDGTREWLKESQDEMLQNLKIIFNQNNGFAKGNNLGIKHARGRYLLVLNPDTELQPSTLKTMLGFMEKHSNIGISTCKVMLPDGRLDLACRRRFPNPWNSFKRLFLKSNADYNFTDMDENQSLEIDSCMGAFMMIRRLASMPGLFDEDFFMYGEDLDLCWRAKEAGFKVWYYPETSIVHYKGSSSKKTPFRALKWFHDAMWVFYQKHYGNRYPFWFGWIVWLGIYCRLVILWAINFFRREKFVSK